MSTKSTAAKRSRRAAEKPVESSTASNLRPRQPKLRQTPPRGDQPKQPGMDARHAEKMATRRTITAEAIKTAQLTGMLPHEWLLAVMRGEQINHYAYDSETQEIVEVIVLPTFADRMEAAKAAAPYFSVKLNPKLPTGPLDPSKQPGVMEVPLVDSMQKWTELAADQQRTLKKKVTE